MATVADLKQRLADMPDDQTVAWSLWNVQDVMDAEDMIDAEPLTHQEREQVLESVHRQQDAGVGIDWDVIQTHIRMLQHVEVSA